MWLPDAAQVAEASTKKGRKFIEWTKDYLREIVNETSAHGWNHLTKPGRHTFERVTWFFILIGAATGAIMLCLSTYDRYRTSPVVTSLERNYIDWKFILPAVYICPNQFITNDDGNVNKTVKRLLKEGFGGADEQLLANFVTQLTNASGYVWLDALEPFRNHKTLPTKGFLDIVVEALPKFLGSTSIGKLIQTTTEVGICWAHNSMIARWTAVDPDLRAKIAEGKNGGEILSTSSLKKPNEFSYQAINSDYRSYIHAANTLPSLVRASTDCARYSSSKVRLRARETYTTEAARSLAPAQRRCFTDHEVPAGSLRPLYTTEACRETCRARLAKTLCGCRPYFVNVSDIVECDIPGMLCLSKHLDTLRFLSDQKTGKRLDCGCLPACDGFSFELLKATSDPLEKTSTLPPPAAMGQQVVEMSHVRFKRDVLFSIVDLCVSFGGAVGLCLGCSVLTLVELLYYFSIRVLLALRLR